MTRKAIALATLHVTLKHTTENGVETVTAEQALTGGVGANTEVRPLDWEEREIDDKIFSVVLVKKGLLVLNRTRCNLHLGRMLLRSLLNLLQMLVITVLCKPRDDVFIRPVNLKSVGVFIVDVILEDSI